MAESAEFRSQIYAVLSIAFSSPREGMGAPGARQTVALILREATRALVIAIPERALEAIEEVGEELAVDPGKGGGAEMEAEYNRLFAGPGRPCVYPYESPYRDSMGLVMGPSATEVLRAYRRSKLMINTEFRDLPDHMAVEFEFMARLCWEEAIASSTGHAEQALRLRQEQHSFLKAHLAAWLPALCGEVIRETFSAMYRGLAKIAAIFIAWDREGLEAQEFRWKGTRA